MTVLEYQGPRRKGLPGEAMWNLAALGVWGVLILVVAVIHLARPDRNSLFPLYHDVGLKWLQGEDVFARFEEYRYSPLVAAAFAPLAVLPLRLGSILWLVINTGVFLWGYYGFARRFFPGLEERAIPAKVLLLATPLLIGNVNNMQANLLVLGLMMAAMTACLEKRWWVVAVLVGVATLFKLFPLALGLVLLVYFPRQLWWRMLVVLAAGLVLPFLMQRWEFVHWEYWRWMYVLRNDDRTQQPMWSAYKDGAFLWRLYTGHAVNVRVYQVVQVAMAGLVGLMALLTRKWRTEKEALAALLALVLGWIIVFGPSTEAATYCLIAVYSAWLPLELMGGKWNKAAAALAWVGYAILLVGAVVALFPVRKETWAAAIRPHGGAVMLVVIAWWVGAWWKARRARKERAELPVEVG